MHRNWILVLILIFLVLQLIVLNRAQAEYRVYRLGVKYGQTQPEQQILSTLDDIQYMTYYKLTPGQETYILDHWMCPGRTDGFKKYCSKPITPTAPKISSVQAGRAPAQSPATFTKPLNTPQQPAPVVLQ